MKKRIGLVLAGVAALFGSVVWPVVAGLTIDLGVSNAVNVVLHGQQAEDYFGTDLGVGDINGDGIEDVAVGAYLADGPDNSRNGAGEVYVYYGKSATDWPAVGRLPDVTVYGAAAGNVLGGDEWKQPGHIAVADLDGDQVGDLIVSTPKFANDSLSRGRVWIIWGRNDLPGLLDLAAIPTNLKVTTVSAEAQSRDFLGAALAAGDFDGDGVSDLAMSAPNGDTPTSGADVGIVYVLFGGSHLRGRDIWLNDVPTDVSVFVAMGPASQTKLGSYLAFGKLSGDAIDDLVIGSEQGIGYTGTVNVMFGGSHARGTTWDLARTPADWSAVGEAQFDQLGWSLATGDINADGQADLIMGAPSADGPAGPNTGQAIGIFGPLEKGQQRNLATNPGDLIVYGPQGGQDPSWLGESVTVGDFNGDGVGDLLVGARQANGFDRRSESGMVYLFYGDSALAGALDMRSMPADITLVGAQARDFTGYVAAGDVTGDHIDDIITSATDAVGLHGELQAGTVYILFGSQVPPTPLPTSMPAPTPRPTAAPPLPPNLVYLPVITRN